MASIVNQAATAVQGMVTAPLAEGSKLPSTLLKADNPQSASVDLSTLKGKNLVAGVPGAFSPACSSQVPGYVEQAQKFADKGELLLNLPLVIAINRLVACVDNVRAGIQGIYIIAVNDVFVVQAWREKLNAKDSKLLHFLSDDAGAV